MGDSLAGVVLAAGAGTRLRPLTRLRPKPLCPVGDRPLVDHALARLAPVTGSVAVNVHHGRAQMEVHLAGRAHLSVEHPRVLGTAGALGALRDWIDGRPTVLTYADAWLEADLADLVAGWDGERVRMLTVPDPDRGDFGDARNCGAALLPWSAVRGLAAEPSGLYRLVWGPAHAEGRLELVKHLGRFVDCGTVADYLAANLAWSGGAPVIGAGAEVEGAVERTVVWPGARVHRQEHLVDAVRADELTVLVR
jgi:NDP-sugar pyrophosphorylase family protein